MSALINKMLNLVGFDSEEELMEEEENNSSFISKTYDTNKETTNPFKKNNSKLVNLSNANQLKLVVMQPTSFDDAQDVCDHLKEKKPVVINLEYADKETARRLIDFLSGAVYGVDGHIQKVSPTIFLIVPFNVDILSDSKEDKNKGTFPWTK
ncbi:MAG: cell division protein SepF [Clostridiales bacterium]|nr:cell division protein SepF [Clostridiales bacterium]